MRAAQSESSSWGAQIRHGRGKGVKSGLSPPSQGGIGVGVGVKEREANGFLPPFSFGPLRAGHRGEGPGGGGPGDAGQAGVAALDAGRMLLMLLPWLRLASAPAQPSPERRSPRHRPPP